MKYRPRFEALIEELRGNRNIAVQCADLGAPLDVADLERSYGVKLDPELAAFYSELDGGEIRWTVTDDAQALCAGEAPWSGCIDIFAAFMLAKLRDWSAAVQNLDLDDKTAKAMKHFVPFDRSGDEATVGFMVRNGTVSSELWVLNGYSRDFDKQEQSFDAYIDAILRCKGLTSFRMLWDNGEADVAFDEATRKMTALARS